MRRLSLAMLGLGSLILVTWWLFSGSPKQADGEPGLPIPFATAPTATQDAARAVAHASYPVDAVDLVPAPLEALLEAAPQGRKPADAVHPDQDREWAGFPRTAFDPVVELGRDAIAGSFEPGHLMRNSFLNPFDLYIVAAERKPFVAWAAEVLPQLRNLQHELAMARRDDILAARAVARPCRFDDMPVEQQETLNRRLPALMKSRNALFEKAGIPPIDEQQMRSALAYEYFSDLDRSEATPKWKTVSLEGSVLRIPIEAMSRSQGLQDHARMMRMQIACQLVAWFEAVGCLDSTRVLEIVARINSTFIK